jgi:membrane-associated protease RseP (regulator of RpoE activity)
VNEPEVFEEPEPSLPTRSVREYLLHTLLFFLTFLTTALAGVAWLNKNPLELTNFPYGITYGLLILLMLASHEFGHYWAARYHKVDTTLPFFLQFHSFLGLFPFGTLGAVIRIRSRIPSRKTIFDIAAAGPIAGFVVSVGILIYGFLSLPPIEYLYTIHPEYESMASIPAEGLTFGTTLLYSLLGSVFAPPGAFVPPMNEIYHYPFLCVGWFGMFVTAMNLIPVGQLDGGHLSYSMFGDNYHKIAQASLVALVILGTAGFLPLLDIPIEFGWTGWLFWALILVFFMRSTRLRRPQLEDETPLDRRRMAIGWACFLIFLLSFSLTPITFGLN